MIEVEVEAENEEGELNRVWLEDEFTITSSSLSKLFATDNVRKVSSVMLSCFTLLLSDQSGV